MVVFIAQITLIHQVGVGLLTNAVGGRWIQAFLLLIVSELVETLDFFHCRFSVDFVLDEGESNRMSDARLWQLTTVSGSFSSLESTRAMVSSRTPMDSLIGPSAAGRFEACRFFANGFGVTLKRGVII